MKTEIYLSKKVLGRILGQKKLRRSGIFKCPKCGEVLVNNPDNEYYFDEYDVLKNHMYYCKSKEGRAYQKAIDEEEREW